MKLRNKIILGSLITVLLIIGGCLVSGTFIVVETFSFTTQTGFYPESIDLTDNSVWDDHREDIDDIEMVGFELWITNNEPSEWSFWAYMDNYDVNCYDQSCADASSSKFLIFDTLTIPANTGSGSHKYISYAKSFDLIRNLDAIKKKVLTGQFNYYGYATGGGAGYGGKVDSVKVIITVNASDT